MSLKIQTLPAEVQKLLNIFKSDARLVGGCVRDLLLEKSVNDFDFATRFLPEQTIKILRKNKIKALETGIKFGTVTAVVGGKNFEITTLREDENQRGRDTDVRFVDDYFLDAKRRDFTINALYLDFEGKIYDYFDGITDLKNGQVKFIGDAASRIKEDYLRILRFFRFSAKYAKTIDVVGLESCHLQKKNLNKLSKERVRQEFIKMFEGCDEKKLFEILEVMQAKGIFAEIFSSKVQIESLKKIVKEGDFALKIAVLFLSKKDDVLNLISEICATNKEKSFFKFIFEHYPNCDLKYLKRLLAFVSKDDVLKYYLFCLAKNSSLDVQNLQFLRQFNLPDFPVDASDLIAKGLQGKEIGDALVKLKNIWADGDFDVSSEDLLRAV